MPLQFVALDGQFDAETLGRHQGLQTPGQGAEQLVALEVASDGAVDVKKNAKFQVQEFFL